MRARPIIVACGIGTLAAFACGDPYDDAEALPGGGADASTGDGAAPDTSTASDGGGSDTDADAGAGCGWFAFADQFERAELVGSWKKGPSYSGATISIGTAPISKGSSLRAEVAVADASGGPFANWLEHAPEKPPGAPPPRCLSLDLSVMATNVSVSRVAFAALSFGGYGDLSLWLTSSGTIVLSFLAGFYGEDLATVDAPKGAWHRIELQHAIGTKTATLRVDGFSNAVSWDVDLSEPTDVRVGTTKVLQAGTATYWIDDVSMR